MNKPCYSLTTILTATSIVLVSSVTCQMAFAVKAYAAAAKRTAQSPFVDSNIFKGNVTAEIANGEKLLLNGQYPQAADVFHTALNQNSKDPQALNGFGFALALQFKLDGAEEQFNKALKINPNDPLAHVGLAFTKLNRLQSSSMTVIQQRDAIFDRSRSRMQNSS